MKRIVALHLLICTIIMALDVQGEAFNLTAHQIYCDSFRYTPFECYKCWKRLKGYTHTRAKYVGSLAKKDCPCRALFPEEIEIKECRRKYRSQDWEIVRECNCPAPGHCRRSLPSGYNLPGRTSFGSVAKEACNGDHGTCEVGYLMLRKRTCLNTQLWSSDDSSTCDCYPAWDLVDGSDCWRGCESKAGACNIMCGFDGYCCKNNGTSLGHCNVAQQLSAGAATHHVCVQPAFEWFMVDGRDCWEDCHHKAGKCKTCNDGIRPGYCCKKGDSRCNLAQQSVANNGDDQHVCVRKTPVTKEDDCANLGNEYSYTHKAFDGSIATKQCFKKCSAGSQSLIKRECSNDSGYFKWTDSECHCYNGCPLRNQEYTYSDLFGNSTGTRQCSENGLTCSSGDFKMKTRTCNFVNGTYEWTKAECKCVPGVCNYPGDSDYMFGLGVGSVVNQSCSSSRVECSESENNYGYAMCTCQADGSWSGSCGCGSLPGGYTYSDGLYFGSVATAACYNVNLTCPSGKSVLKKRECKLSYNSGKLQWSYPKCECHTDIMCPELGHKYSYSNGLLPDSVARYRCTLNRPCSNNPKYKTRRCVITDRYGIYYWSAFTPCKCRSEYSTDSCGANLGSKYSYTNKTFAGSVAIQQCSKMCTAGSDSLIKRICTKESGEFKWTDSKCRCYNGCPLRPKELTYLNSSGDSIGTRRCSKQGLTCTAGYSKLKIRECQLNSGQWTDAQCECHPDVCDNLGDEVPYTLGLAIGSEARPLCNINPRVQCSFKEGAVWHHAVCTCLSDGTWSGSCSGCDPLSQTGYLYSDGLFFGSVATAIYNGPEVSCSSGESKFKKRECKLSYINGQSAWSQPEYECHTEWQVTDMSDCLGMCGGRLGECSACDNGPLTAYCCKMGSSECTIEQQLVAGDAGNGNLCVVNQRA